MTPVFIQMKVYSFCYKLLSIKVIILSNNYCVKMKPIDPVWHLRSAPDVEKKTKIRCLD